MQSAYFQVDGRPDSLTHTVAATILLPFFPCLYDTDLPGPICLWHQSESHGIEIPPFFSAALYM